MKKLIKFLLLLLFINNLYSQSNFTIRLNKNLDPNKLKIFYADGPIKKFIYFKWEDDKTVIKENYKSTFLNVIVMYPDSNGTLRGNSFLINGKVSSVKFNTVPDSNLNKLSSYEMRNCFDASHCNESKDLSEYSKFELTEYLRIMKIYNTLNNDSIEKKYIYAIEQRYLKEMDYIKLHSNQYFFFWYFTQEILPILKKKYIADVYEAFNSFPNEFINSYEGQIAKDAMVGNLYVKIGMQSPSFKFNDYKGNEISTNKLKGKYYLLSFWATWCSPCVKEIPQIKAIREKYSNDELEIISVSNDNDYDVFVRGIEKYEMNWTHIFNNAELNNLFGAKPIPGLYLMDKNGIIQYSNWEKEYLELDLVLKTGLHH